MVSGLSLRSRSACESGKDLVFYSKGCRKAIKVFHLGVIRLAAEWRTHSTW